MGWIWIVAIILVALGFLMWECASSLIHGGSQSFSAVHHFHEQLDGGRYVEIWEGADAGFRDQEKERVIALLAAIHRKLGNSGPESLTNISVQNTPGEEFLIAVYGTRYDRGSATETFTWKRDGDNLKLYGYHIQSNDLIIN